MYYVKGTDFLKTHRGRSWSKVAFTYLWLLKVTVPYKKYFLTSLVQYYYIYKRINFIMIKRTSLICILCHLSAWPLSLRLSCASVRTGVFWKCGL